MLVCLAMLFIALSIVGVGARSIPSDDAIMPLWDSIAVTTLDIGFDGNTGLGGWHGSASINGNVY